MKAATPSACSSVMRPARNARAVNSPGWARRTPDCDVNAATTRSTKAVFAGSASSSVSCPVKDLGPGNTTTNAAHRTVPCCWAGTANVVACTPRPCGTDAPRACSIAINARSPDTRTSAREPVPGAELTATMVSAGDMPHFFLGWLYADLVRFFCWSSAMRCMRSRKPSCPGLRFAARSAFILSRSSRPLLSI